MNLWRADVYLTVHGEVVETRLIEVAAEDPDEAKFVIRNAAEAHCGEALSRFAGKSSIYRGPLCYSDGSLFYGEARNGLYLVAESPSDNKDVKGK